MLCILGFSGSGKSQILNKLVSDYGMKKIVTWTTRDKRSGEVGGVDYNFCNDEEFEKLKKLGFFAETTSYVIADGRTVKYGTAIEDLADDKVIILNPEGFRKLNKLKTLNMTSIFVTTPTSVLIERLKERGDNEAEYIRRLQADECDFDGLEGLVNYQVVNGAEQTIDDVARVIYRLYKEN